MVVIAVIGELGKGKTATASAMALNFYRKGYTIFSNYNLYIPVKRIVGPDEIAQDPSGSARGPAGSPRILGAGMTLESTNEDFKKALMLRDRMRSGQDLPGPAPGGLYREKTILKPISSLIRSYNDVERINNGYAFFDELWGWMDSRMSSSHQNKFIAGILLKSRKRGFNLVYTCQGFHQIEKRIRGITDYIIIPDKRIIIKGREIRVNQDILNPFPEKYFLDYTFIDAYVFSNSTEMPISTFTFSLKDVSLCYDTNEEVKDLLTNELDKGIEEEKGFKAELEKAYPGAAVSLVENSGHYKNSFDVELKHEKGLFIFDVIRLSKRKKVNFYLDLGYKNEKKYREVMKKRGSHNYFAYEYNDIFWVIDALKVWAMTDKRTVSIKRLLPESHKIDFLNTEAI